MQTSGTPQAHRRRHRALITGLGDLHEVVRDAEPTIKTAIYEQLGLKVTYLPGQDKIRADVTICPDKLAGQTDKYGEMGRVRGATRNLRTWRRSRW
jgi:hypothetical protein